MKSAISSRARASPSMSAPRPVLQLELDRLKAVLGNRDMILWAVVSASATTVSAAKNLGLETTLITHNDEQLETTPVNSEEAGTAALLINHTLRNGRTVRNEGHVIIHGDVNPGAQIIAGGSVFVWGRLRGIVHAGANGDEAAVVCALDFSPMQLRIATHITVSPEGQAAQTATGNGLGSQRANPGGTLER